MIQRCDLRTLKKRLLAHLCMLEYMHIPFRDIFNPAGEGVGSLYSTTESLCWTSLSSSPRNYPLAPLSTAVLLLSLPKVRWQFKFVCSTVSSLCIILLSLFILFSILKPPQPLPPPPPQQHRRRKGIFAAASIAATTVTGSTSAAEDTPATADNNTVVEKVPLPPPVLPPPQSLVPPSLPPATLYPPPPSPVAGKAPSPPPPSTFSVTFFIYTFSSFSPCHPNEK